MGRDKLELPVGGLPLIHRVYSALEGGCEEILVVASGDWEQRALHGLKTRTVSDLRPGRAGPLAGIEAGLSAARNDRAFVAAADMPFIPEELVAYLLELVGEEGTKVAVPRYEGRLHPLCAAYRREVLADLSFALNTGVRAVHEFLESLGGVRYVEGELAHFGAPSLFLMSVNSPEDLDRARWLAGGEEP